MQKLIFFFSLLIFLVSCSSSGKKQANKETANSVSETQEEDTLSNVKPIERPTELIAYLIFSRSELVEKLKSTSKEQAPTVYKNYKAENDSVLALLMQKESKLLENYYSIFFHESGKKKKKSKDLQTKLARFSEAKIELWEIGEGMVEIRTIPRFYLDLFQNYVSEDLKTYFEITAEEDKDLYSNDGGLSISFQEQGERIASWEKYLKKYPKFIFKNQVLELYKMYQRDYLIGMDNTAIRDYETNVLYPENKSEFDRFMAKYPKSLTTKFIKHMIDADLYGENLYKYLEIEQAKLE